MRLEFFTDKDFKAIEKSFLFSCVPESYILSLLSNEMCEAADYNKGARIYSEADFKRSVGIVLSGRVGVSRDLSNGRQYLMNTIEASGIFGAAALFGSEDTYVTTITADEPCRVVFFPEKLMEQMIGENSVIAKNYILFLSGRIKFLNRKIQGLTTVSASQSVERYIISNMVYDGNEYYVDNIKSYSSLASMLNIGRASLYRSFDTLEAEGIIKRQGKRIFIISPDRLMEK